MIEIEYKYTLAKKPKNLKQSKLKIKFSLKQGLNHLRPCLRVNRYNPKFKY